MASVDRGSVLRALGDVPQYIEARAILLDGNAGGMVAGADPNHCVVWDPASRLIALVGEPDSISVRAAVDHCGDEGALLARDGQVALACRYVPTWKPRLAYRLLHYPHRTRPGALPRRVRILNYPELGSLFWLPQDMLQGLRAAQLRGEVAVSWDGARAASVCFPNWQTESFWDVSVQTYPPYRGAGHATGSSLLLIGRFAALGKRALWFADAANHPSLAVAKKLGFVMLDRVTVFRSESPAPATAGRPV